MPKLLVPTALIPAKAECKIPVSRDTRLVASSRKKISPNKMQSSDLKMMIANADVQINFEWCWLSQNRKAKRTTKEKKWRNIHIVNTLLATTLIMTIEVISKCSKLCSETSSWFEKLHIISMISMSVDWVVLRQWPLLVICCYSTQAFAGNHLPFVGFTYSETVR